MGEKMYKRPKVAVPAFSEANGFYTTKERSFNMSQIRSKGTKPEKLIKKALWDAGVRYKTPEKPLYGKPDISIKKYKLVIFVDGSFWHGYDWKNRKHAIKTNKEFWIAKIERNMERDQEVNAYYQSKGWTVLRFWDLEVKENLGICVKAVLDSIP
ncbi:very short patch repair endonuclease [Algoriphagus sp. NBT04N3]|jgi:DNA mismatch endonuclease, patch repair protein|uniref:very short patch repair endonuclease n=1 Tax=Algoriphagus sp. NBT04N3 TaxID=2705473 RepID=UPI001C638444|nr:very short patch repair endonuclease [Algoriphagus sp. NBT04N3]QYH38457.1 very short patch repair endonuclease [Algoriphagus sp. NBT04N3]